TNNVVFPSQFARLLIEYQEHPEAKSLAPDDSPCDGSTRGLLQRAHIIAGELRYVGKETDRKWEEGDDISIFEFNTSEYGRSRKVIASEEIKVKIQAIGINKCARESGFDRKNSIRKLIRGIPVKRNSYNKFARWLRVFLRHRRTIPDRKVTGESRRFSTDRAHWVTGVTVISHNRELPCYCGS